METVGPAISVRGVSKRYCADLRRSLRYGVADMLNEFTVRRPRESDLRPSEFWALDDLSFDLQPGQALGVVGRNGAGKSTLLRLLAGVSRPDRGEIRLRGRVGTLLSLGAGFDTTLTGRENILIEGAALGMDARRLRTAVDEIVEFAELDEFIDAPVHTYSDGMRMRLGFSVASSMDADILLLDEVLIVGDINFRRKSIEHIKQFVANGGTIVFVSHEMWLIQAMCTEVLHLRGGRTVAHGDVISTINSYYDELGEAERLSAEGSEGTPEVATPEIDDGAANAPRVLLMGDRRAESESPDSEDETVVEIVDVEIAGPTGRPVVTGESVEIAAEVEVFVDEIEVFWGFTIWTPDRMATITTQGTDQDVPSLHLAEGRHRLRATITHMPLMAGTFLLGVAVIDQATRMALALHGQSDRGTLFSVRTPQTTKATLQKTAGALMDLDVRWPDAVQLAPID